MSGNPNKRAPESPKGSQKKSRTSGTSGPHLYDLRQTTVTGWKKLTGDFEDDQLAKLAKNAALKNITIYYHTPETKKAASINRVGHNDMCSIKFTIEKPTHFLEVAIGHGKTMKDAALGCRDGPKNKYGKEVTDELLSNMQESHGQQKRRHRSVTPKPQNAHPDATDKWYELKGDFEDPQLAELAKKVAGVLKDVEIFYQITPEQFHPEDPNVPDGKQKIYLKWCTIEFTKKGEKRIVAIGPGSTMSDAALACRDGLEKEYEKEIVNELFSHMQPVKE